jgi:hypothetical protein
MLHSSGLPKYLWGEAVKHAVYLKNRTPTIALDNVTPFEVYFDKKPNLEGLHEFGVKVWVHDVKGSKLDGRSVIGNWVGFDETSSGHRIYWPEKHSVSVERSVKFDNDAEILVPNSVPLEGKVTSIFQSESEPSTIPDFPQTPVTSPTNPLDDNPTVDHLGNDFEHPPADHGRPKRVRQESAALRRLRDGQGFTSNRPSERHQLPRGIQEGDDAARMAQSDDWEVVDLDVDSGMAAAMAEADALEPTYEEARGRSDWPQWKAAIDVELENLRAAGTWDVVERPASSNVVDSKWVFKLKKNADGTIDKYKARLVARGFTQIYGVDYYETFAPVAKLASIRTLLAIAARNDWPIDMFDFHSAFLNGELDDDEDIYMEQPPDHPVDDPDRFVVKLHKSIYGLKQAGKKWYDSLSRSLADIGFQKSEADPAVFYAHAGGDVVILAIHVDDCTITSSSVSLQEVFKARIGTKFKLTDLGAISWLLGFTITRDRAARTISLSQHAYISTILRRFNFEDCKPLAMPMDPNTQLTKEQCPTTVEEIAEMKVVPYREAVGSLNWAAVGTRPDISFVVGVLSQYLENPGRVHWEAVKRVFRYLQGTKDWRLTYGGEARGIMGFTDADGASQEHRRAISGSVILIDGGAVSWSSKKQELVTLSTTEAEYVATTHAAKEIIWFRRLLGEIFRPLEYPITLYSDNQSSIALAHTQGQFHARTKHIDIRYHFIRYTIDNGQIQLMYCPTEDMTADILTKALPSGKAKHFARALGLIRFAGEC